MRILAALLFAVSSVSAYFVTYPTTTGGWTTHGPNYLKWDRVSTDPTTFAVYLKNLHTTNQTLLLSKVDGGGTGGYIICPAPSGGWPTGVDFQLNLVHDPEDPYWILAQSPAFTIT